MTRIYIIRHAEAEGNLFRRIHGQYDTTITPRGHRQIAALRERFAEEPVDACYSSDLVRTRTTAQAIWLPKGLPLQLDARFREVRLGRWEDLPFGQLEREDPEELTRFSRDPLHWRVEGAETLEEYAGRFLAGLRDVAERNDGRTAAIFSHGSVIRAMQMYLFYGPDRIPEIGHCDNTGVSLLEYENGAFRAVYLNDSGHLTPELSIFTRQNWWRKDGARRDEDLWFRPLRDAADWYAACRREAWQTIYGEEAPFDGYAYWRSAADAAGSEPWSLCQAMLGDEPAGILQLNPEQLPAGNAGWISFLYLLPAFRGRGLGVQLVGQAVSYYRARGRSHLQLSVSPENEKALALYRRCGFCDAGWVPGLRGDLLLMDWNGELTRDLQPELQPV